MIEKIKVLEIELDKPIVDLFGWDNYTKAQILVRWQGEVIGFITVPLFRGFCKADIIKERIESSLKTNLQKHIIRKHLNLDRVLIPENTSLMVSIAVCTRNRTDQLKDCLLSIRNLRYPTKEILVIDNAPDNDNTQQLVESQFPEFRYIREDRPGLDWARNRAINEAKGEIIAYTDDDVIVDSLWVTALNDIFIKDPSIMAVTGLVSPYELETESEILFERYGGFGRGFERKWYCVDNEADKKAFSFHFGTGNLGTGANMAYRRSIFEKIGDFDPALDVGTVTNGGGDIEMFFRVLEEGYTLVYEPSALVWHRHRKTYKKLHEQLTNHGVGLYSYLVRSTHYYPARKLAIIRFGLWWFWYWSIKRYIKSFFKKPVVPRDLIVAEMQGAIIGLRRYAKAKLKSEEIKTNVKNN